MAVDRQKIEPNAHLSPNHIGSQITRPATNSGVIRCTSQALSYGIWCVCVCVKAFGFVQKCVLAYWQMRKGKRDRE